MNLLHSVQARYFVPALILLSALVIAASLYLSPAFSQAAGTTDMGCGGDAYGGINCMAGEEVRQTCGALYMAYQDNDESSFSCPGPGGYYWSGNRGGCRYEPVLCGGCVANSGCAASTCSTTTCSDSCGNTYAGTQNCQPPVYTCQDYGYNYGTVGCCYNNADRSDDGCYDVCPATPGNQSSYSQCNCTDNPSGPGCNTQPTCTNNSYCSGTTYISSDTCNGQTGSTPNSPSCGYVEPPSCTPDASCAAGTPVGNVCYDSCGNGYAGTYSPSCTPTAACAASTPVGNICYDSCGNGYAGTYVASCTPSSSCAASTPVGSTCSDSCGYLYAGTLVVGCGTPSATLTAAPTRVRSGQTSTLTLTATGVTTSCTVSGPGVNSTVAASSCGVSSTIVTPAITSQVTYKVTCDSTVDIAKIIVNLVPKVVEF